MKNFYLLVAILWGICSSVSLAQLPQDHSYQKDLRSYLNTLRESDFEVSLSKLKVDPSYFSSDDEVYKAWLFFGYQPAHMMRTKGLRVDASYFTLEAIEAGGNVNMTVGAGNFMSAISTASYAAWDYEGNPHYGSRAVKLRAFVAAAVDMMMQDQDHERGKHTRSDFLSLQLIRWAYAYGVAKDELPQQVRVAYEQGLIRMFEKLEQWGPTGTHADIDVAAMPGVLYAARFVDSQDLTDRAHAYIDGLLAGWFSDAGYIDHGSAYDAGYNGISLYFMNWAAQLSDYPPLVEALQKMSKLKAHMSLPDPDGRTFSPFHSNPSSGADAPHDLWSPYHRDVGIAKYSDDAVYLAIRGGRKSIYSKSAMLDQMQNLIHYFNKVFTPPSDEAPGTWIHRHWIDGKSFNATAFYYENGLYDKLKTIKNSGSELTKAPFERSGEFTESFADKFLSVKRATYGTIIFNDRLSWWTGEGETETLNGFGGGNLSAFWTPETGSVLLGGTRTAHSGGLDLKDWEIWPVHALSGETADGLAFSSGLQRYPEAKYELSGENKKVTITGDLTNIYPDPRDGLHGQALYKRVFTMKDNGVEVTTLVQADGSNSVNQLYEILPVYRRNAYHQESAVPTEIEFKVNGSWQSAGNDFKEVTSIRLKRFDGVVFIDFEQPARVKLSAKEFYQDPEKKLGMQARNIMIDLLGSDGAAAKLQDTSVSYFMRSSNASANDWSESSEDENKNADTTPPQIKTSYSPQNPDNSDEVRIGVEATDNSGISRIEIFAEGKSIKTCRDTKNCTAGVGPYNDGSYTYYATATDNQNNEATSEQETLQVNTELEEDKKAPAIDITHSPDEIYANEIVTFKASSSDDSGIKSLKIYIDDQLAKQCTDISECTFKKDSFSAVKHSYYATATDKSANANKATSETKTINVLEEPSTNTAPQNVSVTLEEEKDFLESTVKDVSDPDGDAVNINYDWRLNGKSIAVINFPFDVQKDPQQKQIVKDYTSVGNDGITDAAKANPTWTKEGKIGGGIDFDGERDFIKVPSGESLAQLQSFSVEAWVKHDNWGDKWASIISKPFSNEKWENPWSVFKLSRKGESDNLNFQITVGDNEALSLQSDGEVPSGEWTHIVGTYDGETLKLFINGALDTELSIGKPLIRDTGTDIYVGQNSNIANTDTENYKGTLDELRVYNRALSVNQIQRHFSGTYNNLSLDLTKANQKWEVAVTANDSKSRSRTTTSNSVITKKAEQSDKSDNSISITQNYPNPFTSSTTIDMNLEAKETMTIKIYDSLGRHISTVFEGEMPAGPQTMEIDGSNMASGIYFCRFAMESEVVTKKMTNIK